MNSGGHFQAARATVSGLACVFEKALLTRCAACSLAARHALAVGTGDARDVHVRIAAAQQRYGGFSDLPWPAIVSVVAVWPRRRRHDSRR